MVHIMALYTKGTSWKGTVHEAHLFRFSTVTVFFFSHAEWEKNEPKRARLMLEQAHLFKNSPYFSQCPSG